jgi:hypothetical protein
VLFFYFVPDTTRDLFILYNMYNIVAKHFSITMAPVQSRSGPLVQLLISSYVERLCVPIKGIFLSRFVLKGIAETSRDFLRYAIFT